MKNRRKVIASELWSPVLNEEIEAWFHGFSRDGNGDPVAILEKMDGQVVITGAHCIKFQAEDPPEVGVKLQKLGEGGYEVAPNVIIFPTTTPSEVVQYIIRGVLTDTQAEIAIRVYGKYAQQKTLSKILPQSPK